MGLIIGLLVSTVSVMVAAYIVPGVKVENFTTAIIVAIVLGVLNTFVKPILILFTLPINILTLGLLSFLINASIILLAASLVPGFSVSSLWIAILFSIALSLIQSFLSSLVK